MTFQVIFLLTCSDHEILIPAILTMQQSRGTRRESSSTNLDSGVARAPPEVAFVELLVYNISSIVESILSFSFKIPTCEMHTVLRRRLRRLAARVCDFAEHCDDVGLRICADAVDARQIHPPMRSRRKSSSRGLRRAQLNHDSRPNKGRGGPCGRDCVQRTVKVVETSQVT